MDVDDNRGRGARLCQLLDADRERDRVEARAAVLARDQDAEQAGGGGGLDRLLRESMLQINLGRMRPGHSLRQLAYGSPEGRVLRR